MGIKNKRPRKETRHTPRNNTSSEICGYRLIPALFLVVLTAAMNACNTASPALSSNTLPQSPTIEEAFSSQTLEPVQAHEDSPTSTNSPNTSSPAGSWKTYPIVPVLSPRVFEIYQNGQTLSNRPQAFSKVGDGEVATSWFLTMFDRHPETIHLGPYQELEEPIAYFSGSFARQSIAARAGFNTTRVLNPLFAANDLCQREESPLECELRLHRPSFVFISLGTNQVWTPEVFETELRMIIEICIERGVIPILATKGDNLEGDHRINAIIAEVAREYEVPLWNFWLALQSLPDQGLQPDGEHLTWAETDFDDPDAKSHAWPNRNLAALQVLQRLMLELGSR